MERKQREGQKAQHKREERLRKQKEAVLQTVNSQGGAFLSTVDVIHLMRRENTKAGKLKAVKAQIDHEKLSWAPLLHC